MTDGRKNPNRSIATGRGRRPSAVLPQPAKVNSIVVKRIRQNSSEEPYFVVRVFATEPPFHYDSRRIWFDKEADLVQQALIIRRAKIEQAWADQSQLDKLFQESENEASEILRGAEDVNQAGADE